MIEKAFNPDLLYNRIVHYYIDKKGHSKERANSIAQKIIQREIRRRMCKNFKCLHTMDDHIRNSETCLVLNCDCRKFEGMKN